MAIKKSRQEKYPETTTFKYHNQNPKNRITGDCAFRAISLATGKDYNTVVREMAEIQCKTGYALNDKKGIERYMESIGWIKCKQPRDEFNQKYTGKDFCYKLQDANILEPIVATIGGHHIICIRDGKINDIWDCSNKCIGNYWKKGN